MPGPEYSTDWVAHAFGLGRPSAAVPGGRGQKNSLGVLRLESSKGRFAVKRFREEPRPAALAVEFAAYESGFPMPAPVPTIGGEPYAVCSQVLPLTLFEGSGALFVPGK